MELLKICLIVCPFVLLGSFVDSVAGGGGIITLPAYLLAGLPVHTAAGTNKIVAACGTATATVKFFRSGKVMLRIALLAAAGSILGATLGSRLALFVPEKALELAMMIALPAVALFLTFRRDIGKEGSVRRFSGKTEGAVALCIGLCVGLYDGLIGPGTGTFLMLCFSGILGLDLLVSDGCAKVANLASNLGSALVFALSGKILYLVAIPAALCSMLGGFLGARFAIKGGSKQIRKVMFVVLGLLFVKMIYEYIF